MRRVTLGVISLLLSLILFLATACGPGQVELDPRDEAVLEGYLDRCDRSSSRATLVVDNQSAFRVKIHLISRSGSRWTLQPTVRSLQNGLRINVSRQLLDNSGGYIMLELLGGGLIMVPPRPIPLTPLSCDVGTLIISPSPSMSMYAGAEF